jgi:hypothetical protein
VQATDIRDLIPAQGVRAVSLNVAVTNPVADGFVTVYDCGVRNLVASVNYVRGETVSNLVIAPVSSRGEICFYSSAATDIVADVSAWLGDGYTGIEPNRLIDTRPADSPNALRTVTKTRSSEIRRRRSRSRISARTVPSSPAGTWPACR